jgi:hypothetical protein
VITPLADILSANTCLDQPPSWVRIVEEPLRDSHDWTKFFKAQKIDPVASFWLGDTSKTVVTASSLGGRSALVMTKRAREALPTLLKDGTLPNIAAPDPIKAIEWLEAL